MTDLLTPGHATLRLRDIDPAKNQGFSPNLYRYLKRHGHFYRDGGILDNVYAVKDGTRLAEFFGAGTLMIGFSCDGDFVGSRLIAVLCNGAKEDRFSYPGRAMVIEGFWDRYLLVGRCAIDPVHEEHFMGDRYEIQGDERVCRWCGARHQRIVTPRTATVFDESWVDA